MILIAFIFGVIVGIAATCAFAKHLNRRERRPARWSTAKLADAMREEHEYFDDEVHRQTVEGGRRDNKERAGEFHLSSHSGRAIANALLRESEQH